MVERESMPEGCSLPGICIVTLRALAWEVVERFIFSMTGGAVGEARVVKYGAGPLLNDMAVRALARIVKLGRGGRVTR